MSVVILVMGYLALVTAQALAVILLYVFGPLFLALLSSRQLSQATYRFFRTLLQVLLWPAMWSLVFALFTGALVQAFTSGPIVNLIPAIFLVLLAVLLTQIARLTGYLRYQHLECDGGCTLRSDDGCPWLT